MTGHGKASPEGLSRELLFIALADQEEWSLATGVCATVRRLTFISKPCRGCWHLDWGQRPGLVGADFHQSVDTNWPVVHIMQGFLCV